MSSLPPGAATFLFSYTEGSTKLAQVHADQWEKVRDRHNSMMKTAIEFHKVMSSKSSGTRIARPFKRRKTGLR